MNVGQEKAMLREVQTNRQTLDSSVQQLATCTSIEDFQIARASVLEAVTALDESLSSCFGSIDNKVRKPASGSAAKVTQVFDTPELLEMFLVNLGLSDLLTLQQVNGTMRDGITSSTRVRRLMGTTPHPKSAFYIPFNPSPARSSFSCTIDAVQPEKIWTGVNLALEEMNPHLFELKAAFDTSQGLPRLGSRCRGMLICQPPIKKMDVKVACCCGSSQESPYAHFAGYVESPRLQPLLSESGITVGDVLDATTTLVEQHRLCPLAITSKLDDQGLVPTCDIAPQFTARILLGTGDPIFEAQESIRAEKAVMRAAQKAKSDRMEAYVRAKLRAHVAGSKIPTLDEFEAASAAEEAGGNEDDI